MAGIRYFFVTQKFSMPQREITSFSFIIIQDHNGHKKDDSDTISKSSF